MMQVAVSLADSFAVIIGDLHLAHMGLDMPQDVVEESVVSVSVAEADSITEAGLTSEARNADQQAAEDRFREARECDRMYEEDSDTKRWLDDLEAEAREAFSQAVHAVIQRDAVYADHVQPLKAMARRLRALTTIEVLAERGTTWERLEVRVFETLAADEQARQLAERLKTEAGRAEAAEDDPRACRGYISMSCLLSSEIPRG